MRDKIHYKPHKDHLCEDGQRRTVYVKGTHVPCIGWMALPDTYFSCEAYVLIGGKRCRGFVTPIDNRQEFRPYTRTAHMLAS